MERGKNDHGLSRSVGSIGKRIDHGSSRSVGSFDKRDMCGS